MSKKKKGDKKRTEKILLATAIIQLIEAILDLLEELNR